jgi:hypothetical protein
MPLFNWAASTEAWPSRQRDDPTHLGLSAHGIETGDGSPLLPTRLRWPIPASQRRVTGQGVAEEVVGPTRI